MIGLVRDRRWSVVAAVIFGIYWFKQHQATDGNGALIAAQEGDYKVKPDDPGGMKVAGEGDTAIADQRRLRHAATRRSRCRRVPEAPVAGTKAAPGGQTGPARPRPWQRSGVGRQAGCDDAGAAGRAGGGAAAR